MHDQADELRQLVQQRRRDGSLRGPGPLVTLVLAGKGGVGTTTLAANLAVAAALSGGRTILVDADLNQADATQLCGLRCEETIHDVLAGRRSIHEVLTAGPGGLLVLPGQWPAVGGAEYSSSAFSRLALGLQSLGAHADLVIVDAGSGANRCVQRLWPLADRALLLTTPDCAAVVDAYAVLKVLGASGSPATLELVVNQADSDTQAEDTAQRLARTCQRFLGIQPALSLCLPRDAQTAQCAGRGELFVLQHPSGPGAATVGDLAEGLVKLAEARHGLRRRYAA